MLITLLHGKKRTELFKNYRYTCMVNIEKVKYAHARTVRTHTRREIFSLTTKPKSVVLLFLFYFVLIFFFRIEFNFVHIREECTSLRHIIYLRVIKTSFTADGGLNFLSLLFSSLFSCATLSNSDGESLVCMCTVVSSRINCNLSTPLKVSKPIL